MLKIYDAETLNNKDLNIKRKKSKKTQILLYDTNRRIDDFINKLKYRRNGKYEDIPHFIVSKMGVVYQVFDTDYSSNTFNDSNIDKKQIKIAIENLGWLNKNTINGFLFNWIGDTYRSEPYVKNWRNHFYWDKYSEDQLNVIKELCDFLIEKHKIRNESVPSHGYFSNAPNFKGIICKSNFSDIYTDINSSFNFNIFLKDAK